MKIKVETKIDELEHLINSMGMLGDKAFPHTARAIDISASFVQRTWVEIAQGNDLSGKPDNVAFTGSIDYANSIHIVTVSPFHKQVISDSKIGETLEKGSEEYDMKPALVKGPKSRVAEDGHRYNIIPFRHKVKELKQTKIGNTQAYTLANRLVRQTIIGFKIDSEGKKRFAYAKWTQSKRLSTKDKFLAGLVRMDTSTGKASSSTYLTFRVVNLKQTGKWIRKAQDAWEITKQVKEKTQDKVQKFVQQAIHKDLGILGGK
jgi:hypothetical protein